MSVDHSLANTEKVRQGTLCSSEFYRCLSLDLGLQKASQVTRLLLTLAAPQSRQKQGFTQSFEGRQAQKSGKSQGNQSRGGAIEAQQSYSEKS